MSIHPRAKYTRKPAATTHSSGLISRALPTAERSTAQAMNPTRAKCVIRRRRGYEVRVTTNEVAIQARSARAAIRRGQHTGPTRGLAPGFVQANLAILPKPMPYDFLLFCQRNPAALPAHRGHRRRARP